jgi:hypothetical protein
MRTNPNYIRKCLEVYEAYRRNSGKPYKLPKDFNSTLEKMQPKNRESLFNFTDLVFTKLSNI